jgi:sulfite reductase (NADPH) flavoprotein alpha-component
MNQMTPPPRLEIIPPTAPFTEGQRSWLNGFLVGMLSLDGSTPLSPELNGAVLAPAGDGDDGEAPWHDQTMAIADRMKLAEGRPLRRRMMAAMAQQDCGQCGYNCNDYSEAIAGKTEPRLNLCVPGGKETASIGLAGCARGRDTDRRRGARPFARQSGAGDVRIAPAAQQEGIGKGNLAYRFRSRRLRARLCRRRFLRHFCPQRVGTG